MEQAVYVLWDGERSYYVGSTRHYKRRLFEHQFGIGSKTTQRWFTAGKPILEYWKIVVRVPVKPNSFMRNKTVARHNIEWLESLVLKTLRKQNRGCHISM